MARVNKKQILENLFWKINSLKNANVDFWKYMDKYKTIEKEDFETKEAIDYYLADRLGFGVNTDIDYYKILREKGYL